MEESNKCYPGTNRTRPEELEQRGKGDYCCVPGCHNSRLTKNGEKTKIGIFGFPRTNPEEMKKWTSLFKHIRRKGGTDTFDPMKRSTQVSEIHFPINGKYSGQKSLLIPPHRYFRCLFLPCFSRAFFVG